MWIPKPGKQEKRPLGIPTMLDRAMQALFLLGLEPVVESRSDPRSYGFRPDRSSADALTELHHLLSPKVGAEWVLEGDIKGFFDNINHDWLCQTAPMNQTVLRKWLKAGVIDKGQLAETKAGTPQGGIISPCLANMTLNGLETQLRQYFASKLPINELSKRKLQVVRYADDFVITGASKELLENEVMPWVENFLAERGVALSKAKTRITSIYEGFDFLGWNFRKYVHKAPRKKPTLLIKPSRANTSAFYRKVKGIVRQSGAMTQGDLISRLNPVLKGWAQYHQPASAKKVFGRLDDLIYWRLMRWALRRHHNESRKRITRKYFHAIGNRTWVFATPTVNQKGERTYKAIYNLASTPIIRLKRLPKDYTPYDRQNELAWEKLRVARMSHKLRYRNDVIKIYSRQKGLCALCGGPLTQETGWHDHHIIRRTDGGSDTLGNRALVHPVCHNRIHSGSSMPELPYSGLLW